MSRKVTLGFVPLLDAAPVLMAEARGFFAAEGLDVTLSRETSWATVRDKVAVGALDGAHMLAPMALAAGLATDAAPIIAPFVLNRGGAAVTLSARIFGGRGDPEAVLRRVVALRRAQGATPITFAVVFPHAIHDHLLRSWLSGAGIDPERDVRITVAPPPRMAELLGQGIIEGFCAGEPWSAAAVAAGAGEVAARASRLWPRAPDKVLGLRAAWAAAEPELVTALVRALSAAAGWSGDPDNRAELIRRLAAADAVGVDPSLVAAGLEDIAFSGRAVNLPSETDADWLVGQMAHWGQLDSLAGAAAARRTFRRDLYEAAAAAPSA